MLRAIARHILKSRCLSCVIFLQLYTTDGRIQPPSLPIFAIYKVEHVLSHEDRGSCYRSNKFYHIKWLGYAFEHNSWKSQSNFSA